VLPEAPPCAPEEYDFHLIQIPLRQIVPPWTLFGASSDLGRFERLFEAARDRLSDQLAGLMRWNKAHGILTFVCNFLVPQQNPMGRLLPRYDLRNFVYFVERLNEALDQELRQYKTPICSISTRSSAPLAGGHIQDDAVWMISHGAALSDFDWEGDRGRLEPLDKVSRYYPLSTQNFVQHGWAELVAMVRTIRQADMVKLVLVDLDDTMWRGSRPRKRKRRARPARAGHSVLPRR